MRTQPFGRKAFQTRVSDRRRIFSSFTYRSETGGFFLCFHAIGGGFRDAGSGIRRAHVCVGVLLLNPAGADVGGVGGTIWQLLASHIRRIGPCPTLNSKSCCKRRTRWCRARSRFIRSTNRQSHLHGPRRYTDPFEGIEKSCAPGQIGRRPERAGLGFPRTYPVVGSSVDRRLWRRLCVGTFDPAHLVAARTPSKRYDPSNRFE